jgi:murein L,D-transpeptidase YcbB/YkuD
LLLGPRWQQGRLAESINANRSTRTLMLPKTLPVYMTYWTAWADENGTLHFRDDIYGHDRRLATALDRARSPALRRTAGAS